MTSIAEFFERRIDAIAIGASAGGVEALSVLIPALPAGLNAAVFITMHLPRDRPSLLSSIFGAKCALPVQEAVDKEPIVPGTVYFAPPDYHLLVDRGPQLALSVDDPVHFSRPSIDVLFESAADLYKDRLLGIILTGANEDGAQGLRAVDAAGGMTMAQQPHTALASLMPEAALAATPAALSLSLQEMADFLRTLKKRT